MIISFEKNSFRINIFVIYIIVNCFGKFFIVFYFEIILKIINLKWVKKKILILFYNYFFKILKVKY